MSFSSRTFLAASIGAALTVPSTQADTHNDDSVQEMPAIDQCYVPEVGAPDADEQPVFVEADSITAIAEKQAVYQGDVVITQGHRKMKADSVTHNPVENTLRAEGNVQFSDGQIKSHSTVVTSNVDDELVTMENTQYRFLCEAGRGEATRVLKTGQAIYEMEDGTLTACPEGDSSWRVKASSIELDQDEEQAYFYNTRFEVLDVPIFYMPYMSMPVGDKRKSGLLFPRVSLDTNDGLSINVPFYWNIAPNYDLLTKFNYMERRGLQLDSKFRYLTPYGGGALHGEYIGKDERNTEFGPRWGFNYTHDGIIANSWKLNVDYSLASDIDYFRDFKSDIGNREDGQLLQTGSASYRTQDWDLTLTLKDFQILDEKGNQPYQMLPQLKFNYYAPDFYTGINFDMTSHITRFITDDVDKPSATRVHIEPGVVVPFSRPWGSLTGEARMLATHYQQELTGTSDSDLQESATRAIPEVRVHGILNLERDAGSYIQTLEPQVQYLYIPETDQKGIGLYDTTLLQTDYYGLFRSRKHSGVDRIQKANQFSYGATTRFYDNNYKERLNVSFGQIYYLEPVSSNENTSNYSAWAVEADFNFNDYLFYHGGVQYDIESSAIQLANSALEYRFNGGYIQSNYRYVTKEYIESSVDGLDVSNITKSGISQAGLLASYQITPRWYASAQYFYDTTVKQNIEYLAHLGYRSDCWYISFTYSNQLRSWNGNFVTDPNAIPVYDDNFALNFGIFGFGTSLGAPTASSGDNALGYGRPFYLNN
ncbi:LPS assembly protein LptD [Vibrio nigripulchritudo]|uniref:LPS assembly protein LptD n=1 Tax=Vibrio nigripulchritudo TaxID=28173 RepID=UPI00249178A4|nr:LPS assembly protein LptD [Vibrio nigripulchritudo]BDU36073.1 LPS-assembly protein LptD [Vibrio nigripulchritudo]BDU41728.1 LPS-assembly protein LptD [Vibrio nigripulchritudo]